MDDLLQMFQLIGRSEPMNHWKTSHDWLIIDSHVRTKFH